MTYPPFSGRYGVRSSLPFATTSPDSRQSTCRRQGYGKFGFANRLELGSRPGFGRRLFTRSREINHLNFFLPTKGIVTSMPKPPFLLYVSLKNADRLCFLAYARTDLEGSSRRGLADATVLNPSGGIREKPRLPANSATNESITACQ